MIPDEKIKVTGYVIQISMTAPDTCCPMILPFRLTPDQMKNAQITFEAVQVFHTETDDEELKRNVTDYGRTYRIKDLIGCGVSRELCGVCQTAKVMK